MSEPGRDSRALEQIHSELVRRVRGGEYPAGAKLPSDGELAAEFGCGADIAARALRLLQWDGLARKVFRKGYVSAGPQA
jgi:GntR family transcriptional regulator of arabinose operon